MNSNQTSKPNQKFTRVGNYNKKTGQFVWKKAFKQEYSDFEIGAKWENINSSLERGYSIKLGYQVSTDKDIWAKESKSGKSIRFYLDNVCHTISMRGFFKEITDHRSQFVGIYRINPEEPIPITYGDSGLVVNPQLSNPPSGVAIPLFVPKQEEIIAVEITEDSKMKEFKAKLASMSDQELMDLFNRIEDKD
jgi:hypothetical protein